MNEEVKEVGKESSPRMDGVAGIARLVGDRGLRLAGKDSEAGLGAGRIGMKEEVCFGGAGGGTEALALDEGLISA